MHGSEHAAGLGYGLAAFFFLCFLFNAGLSVYYRYAARDKLRERLWAAVGAVFFLHTLFFLVPAAGAPRRPRLADGPHHLRRPVGDRLRRRPLLAPLLHAARRRPVGPQPEL